MTLTLEKQRYLRQLDQFDKLQRPGPLQGLRSAARARLRELPFPTPKTEDWRFTNVAPLLKMPFEPAPATRLDAAVLPALLAPGSRRLVFVNGTLAPALGSPGPAAAGLELGSLADLQGPGAERISRALGLADYTGQVFTALNTSFLSDGAFVIVPDGAVIAAPIEILYLSSPTGASVTHPRTVLLAGKNSQVTVVERYAAAAPGGVYFNNAVTEMTLGEHALVDHYKVQDEGRAAYHIATTQVAQARGSRFSTHHLSLGGALVRNEVRVRFDAEECEATVNGLYLAGGKQHIDNFTVIDHAQARCASHELYKGILGGEAHGVFNGKIFVRADAQKTDAKQTNKVLLLSDSATINTKPQLEIFADDVKCTHGATVGQLDAEALFYARARGLGLPEARALLTYAFANDIIGRIKIEGLRSWLENIVTEGL